MKKEMERVTHIGTSNPMNFAINSNAPRQICECFFFSLFGLVVTLLFKLFKNVCGMCAHSAMQGLRDLDDDFPDKGRKSLSDRGMGSQSQSQPIGGDSQDDEYHAPSIRSHAK